MVDARPEWIAALDRVIELGALLRRDQEASLDRMGLSLSRVHVLWVLGTEGPSTHRVLAERLGVVPRSVTDLVDGLESIGLVTREPHPDDRRASLVTLTKQGRVVVRRLRTDHERFAVEMFAEFPADLLDPLTSGLDYLLGTLRPLVDDPSS